MLKVCKFGGSSLSDEGEFAKVKKIIESDPSRKVVVVSALGKRNSLDNKITDLLYLTYQHLKYHVDWHELFDEIKRRYLKIEKDLGISANLEQEIQGIEEKLTAGTISEEELVSRGEYLSAKLVSAYLGFAFVDSASLIHFDYDGKVNEKETLLSIASAHQSNPKLVVPGFYGSYPNGRIALFSRGGSDVTGSYMAKGVHGSRLLLWRFLGTLFLGSRFLVPSRWRGFCRGNVYRSCHQWRCYR